MRTRVILLLYLLIHFTQSSFAQPGTETIRQFLLADGLKELPGITHAKGIKDYYYITNYTCSWTGDENKPNRDILLHLLEDAGKWGLNRQDYQYPFIALYTAQPGQVLKSVTDSVVAEIRLTDAAIHFFTDLVQGNATPTLRYDGLGYAPSCFNIPQQLAEAAGARQLALLDKWVLPMPEVKLIREKLVQLEERLASEPFTEERIVSTKVTAQNRPLLKKLYYLGVSDSLAPGADTAIKHALQQAQLQFNLMADGVLRSTIIQELNVPVAERIKQLQLSINYYRWLYCLTRDQSVIVVNIPAAYMKIYGQTGTILEMRMVVGRPSTPTPTLSSRISEVVLYPYWQVPRSIATKELLPQIKQNPGFVNANNFQLLNKQGKIVDPYKVDWSSVTAANFPYLIRQSTGCDNSLGLIKLDFYNPFSVYLHDTPLKNLFSFNKRYYSHGCMRMQKPIELGHMVLKNNNIAIDTLSEKGCLNSQSPVVVKADIKMPVVVWYNPAGTDSTGRVIFYEDVYRKFTARRK